MDTKLTKLKPQCFGACRYEHLFPSQAGLKTPIVCDIAILKAIRHTVGHDEVNAHGFRAVYGWFTRRGYGGALLIYPRNQEVRLEKIRGNCPRTSTRSRQQKNPHWGTVGTGQVATSTKNHEKLWIYRTFFSLNASAVG